MNETQDIYPKIKERVQHWLATLGPQKNHQLTDLLLIMFGKDIHNHPYLQRLEAEGVIQRSPNHPNEETVWRLPEVA